MREEEKAKLFNFSVQLTQAGHVLVEYDCINSEEFKEVMNKWNSKYENTETLVSLLKFLSSHSQQLEKDIRKILY